MNSMTVKVPRKPSACQEPRSTADQSDATPPPERLDLEATLEAAEAEEAEASEAEEAAVGSAVIVRHLTYIMRCSSFN